MRYQPARTAESLNNSVQLLHLERDVVLRRCSSRWTIVGVIAIELSSLSVFLVNRECADGLALTSSIATLIGNSIHNVRAKCHPFSRR